MLGSEKFVIALLIVFTLFIAFLILAPADLNILGTSRTAAPVQQTFDASSIDILAIDHEEHDPSKLAERLQQGETLILLWVNEVDEIKHFYTFHNLASLANFDQNQDGILDVSDPIFNHLYIARYNETAKIIYYIPITQAGIAALLFDLDYLSAEIMNDPTRYTLPAGKVVNTDSSHRTLHAVTFSQHHLQGVTFEPLGETR